MKKILAVLLALAMLFGFAACGGNTEEDTTTTTTDLFADLEEDATEEAAGAEDTTVADAAEETTAADVAEETTAADAAEETTVADTAEETTVAGEATTAATTKTAATTAATTKAAAKGLNSSDIAAVVDYYNKAVIKTDDAGKTAGQSTMKLAGDITGDGMFKLIGGILTSVAKSVLEKNSSATDDIPGRGTLKASDVTKAQASSKNGVTTIVIQLKDQVDGSNGDPKDGGAVARGIGTLGSIDGALNELGATLDDEGKKTVSLTYTDAYIKCTIDENTGKVTGGTWHYTVKIYVGNAEATISGITANIKNLNAAVEYQVAI